MHFLIITACCSGNLWVHPNIILLHPWNKLRKGQHYHQTLLYKSGQLLHSNWWWLSFYSIEFCIKKSSTFYTYVFQLVFASGLRANILQVFLISPSASHHFDLMSLIIILSCAQIIYLFIVWFPPSSNYSNTCRSREAYSPKHCSEAPSLYIIPLGLKNKFYSYIRQQVNCPFVYLKPTFTEHTRNDNKSGTEQ